MFSVYVIENQLTGKIYIGYTSDLKKRLAGHNKILPNKITSYTSKNPGLWKYIYTEKLSDRYLAKNRERQLKTSRGRAFIKKFRTTQLVRSVG